MVYFTIEVFLNWINNGEGFFDYMDKALERRVKVIACQLKGGGSI